MSSPLILPSARPVYRELDRDQAHTGILAPGIVGWNSASVAVTANRAYYARFVPSRPMTITSVAFSVVVAASVDDACDVGIYDAALNRLVSKGATTGQLNATGVKNLAVAATALQAGAVYYAAFSCGVVGGTAASIAMTSFATGAEALFGTTVGPADALFFTAGHPLGAGPITPTGVTVNVAMLALRES